MGWPLGADYDRIAEVYGLEVDYVHQSLDCMVGSSQAPCSTPPWRLPRNGRGRCLRHRRSASRANVRSWAVPATIEGMREQGATHGENPVFGLTSPAAGAAFAMQRYMAPTAHRRRARGGAGRAAPARAAEPAGSDEEAD